MLSNGGSSPVCGVCMFHEWYKTKSHACGKPRLLQATLLQEPESHNMRHLPWCPPPMISSWVSRLKATESPRARQGLGMLCHAALSFLMLATAFFGNRLKKFSTGTSWLLAASFFLRKAQSRDSLGVCYGVP